MLTVGTVQIKGEAVTECVKRNMENMAPQLCTFSEKKQNHHH